MRRVLIFAAALTVVGSTSGHSFFRARARADATHLTLWAWDRPEDLRFLGAEPHPIPVQVAYLDRTVRFDDGRMTVRYRHQPLLVSSGTPLTAVVRLETRGRPPAIAQANSTAALALQAVHASGVTTLQIDFDARRSDRPFYGAVLKLVRAGLSRTVPLSITALASWCVDDPWIDTRDVTEIVPMLFQMGPDARRVLTRLENDGRWPVGACNGAAGLATNEPHDRLPPAHSVYMFNPRAWTPGDLRALGGN